MMYLQRVYSLPGTMVCFRDYNDPKKFGEASPAAFTTQKPSGPSVATTSPNMSWSFIGLEQT